ncbi:MAG: response regulator [Actinomycetota bacterium]
MHNATALKTPVESAPANVFDMTAPVLRVLLVEPDAAAALRLRTDLARVGAQATITHVSGALAALRKLLHDTYDCVLLNLDLPDASGLAACDAFLAHPSQLPVVVLTDNDDPDVALEAVRRGVQDWLVRDRTDAHDIARALEFALARRNNELHLRSVRERLLEIESHAVATRRERQGGGLRSDAGTEERLDYAIEQLQDAIQAASSVIGDVRSRLVN